MEEETVNFDEIYFQKCIKRIILISISILKQIITLYTLQLLLVQLVNRKKIMCYFSF